MTTILGIGDTDFDMYINVPHLPKHDEKVNGTLIGEFPGGMIGNFCCAAAAFGADTGIITAVGDDSRGEKAIANFQDKGIRTEGLQILHNESTYFCVVMLDETREKALTIVSTPAMFPDYNKIDVSLFRKTKYIHTTGGNFSLLEFICSHKPEGVKLSIDLETNMLTELLLEPEILKTIDILFINESTVRSLYPGESKRFAANRLFDYGIELIVITMGKNGAIAFHETGDVYSQEAFPANIVDSTGAGDCFSAILLASLSQNETIKDSLEMASAGAALSIQQIGAQTGHPTKNQVIQFLKAQKS